MVIVRDKVADDFQRHDEEEIRKARTKREELEARIQKMRFRQSALLSYEAVKGQEEK